MLQEEINMIIEMSNESMDKAIDHLTVELSKIRAGKASPAMLSGLMIDYYGNKTPLNQVSNITASDSKTLSIQPWEKSMLAVIEQAIFAANLGLTPMNDGEQIRINVPALTEERRKELVKRVKVLAEDSRVSLRNARREAHDIFKKAKKDGLPEDVAKRNEDKVDDMTHKYEEKIQHLIDVKEKDIMTI